MPIATPEVGIQDEAPSLPPLPEEPVTVFQRLATCAPGVYGFGFGGARIVDLPELSRVGCTGELAFFGIDLELNRKFGTSNMGAAAFIRRCSAGMAPWTEARGNGCHDVGLVVCDDPKDAIHEAFALSGHLAGLGLRPVLIGCDHTASLVNVLGSIHKTGQTPVYLVFDAHLDLGLHHSTSDLHNGNFVDFLRLAEGIQQVVNVGARSWTSHLPVYLGLEGFICLPGGLDGCSLEDVAERLSPFKGQPLYVSIDADVLDSSHAPNVPCPEPFGLSPEALFRLCAWLGTAFEVVGADLCELLPTERSLGAEQALLRCVHALFPRIG